MDFREQWFEATDESGRVYYYEEMSGKTQWDRPAQLTDITDNDTTESQDDIVASGHHYSGDEFDDSTSKARIPVRTDLENASFSSSSSSSSVAQSTEGSSWREAFDESNGLTYYYNIITNETTWERPEGFIPQQEDYSKDDLDGGEYVEDHIDSGEEEEDEKTSKGKECTFDVDEGKSSVGKLEKTPSEIAREALGEPDAVMERECIARLHILLSQGDDARNGSERESPATLCSKLVQTYTGYAAMAALTADWIGETRRETPELILLRALEGVVRHTFDSKQADEYAFREWKTGKMPSWLNKLCRDRDGGGQKLLVKLYEENTESLLLTSCMKEINAQTSKQSDGFGSEEAIAFTSSSLTVSSSIFSVFETTLLKKLKSLFEERQEMPVCSESSAASNTKIPASIGSAINQYSRRSEIIRGLSRLCANSEYAHVFAQLTLLDAESAAKLQGNINKKRALEGNDESEIGTDKASESSSIEPVGEDIDICRRARKYRRLRQELELVAIREASKQKKKEQIIVDSRDALSFAVESSLGLTDSSIFLSQAKSNFALQLSGSVLDYLLSGGASCAFGVPPSASENDGNMIDRKSATAAAAVIHMVASGRVTADHISACHSVIVTKDEDSKVVQQQHHIFLRRLLKRLGCHVGVFSVLLRVIFVPWSSTLQPPDSSSDNSIDSVAVVNNCCELLAVLVNGDDEDCDSSFCVTLRALQEAHRLIFMLPEGFFAEVDLEGRSCGTGYSKEDMWCGGSAAIANKDVEEGLTTLLASEPVVAHGVLLWAQSLASSAYEQLSAKVQRILPRSSSSNSDQCTVEPDTQCPPFPAIVTAAFGSTSQFSLGKKDRKVEIAREFMASLAGLLLRLTQRAAAAHPLLRPLCLDIFACALRHCTSTGLAANGGGSGSKNRSMAIDSGFNFVEDEIIQCIIHLISTGFVLPVLSRLSAEIKSDHLKRRIGKQIASRIEAVASKPFSYEFEESLNELHGASD